jgi:hypothetical protein
MAEERFTWIRERANQMQNLSCWNCGEDCLGIGEEESETIVPIHFVVEKKQVCRECYQILRELDGLYRLG